jgi:ubiquinone/menaquinone biosynthesis C-methylase UbiE
MATKDSKNIEFWNGVASRIGYDFSKLKVKKVGIDAEKEFAKIVNRVLDKNKFVIDIGTADGKFLLSVAGKTKKAIGIDVSEKMTEKANENLKKSDLTNVEFEVADARSLPFNNETFDVVISRRGPVTAGKEFLKEAYRVLKKNGILLEITIGERDKENIKMIFKRGQNYDCLIKGIREAERKRKLLEGVGFKEIKIKEVNCEEYYQTIEDLIFLLENTPIIPNFDVKKDYKKLEMIKRSLSTNTRIKTNSHRIIIQAIK